ncbi:hypothetical protein [Desulfoferrobacter suflitae]|uniref:hypothetical protein n=1 Tax=Desulfoferrobacter suflitae TaxID=2865782 RepID=UPI00216414C8|nr:hypothetical protein [Desulfoferrobacter suflitae]MCK8601537.1 hypothetical protein [Desulfoferrobacter suflitae]
MKPLKVFYDECIQSKILKCDLRAARVRQSSHCIKQFAEINRAQAAFFEDNKEQLIQKMLNNGVGRDLAKINGALLQAFLEVFPARAFRIKSEHQYRSMVCEGENHSRGEFMSTAESTIDLIHECYCHQLEPDRRQHLFELPGTHGALIDEEDD